MLLFHCTGKASDPDATPALGIPEIMSAHPESRRWLTQTEVKNDPKLNLQAGAIWTFYSNLRFRHKDKQIITEITLELESKGVYMERGLKHPSRVISSTIGGGGDITYLSPFWERTARK